MGDLVTIESLPVTSSDDEVGQMVARVLQASRTGVPNRDPRDETWVEPLWRLAGARSYLAFVHGTRGVSLHDRDGTLLVTPMRPPGSGEKGKGFISVIEDELTAYQPGDAELGRMVREAVRQSTPHP